MRTLPGVILLRCESPYAHSWGLGIPEVRYPRARSAGALGAQDLGERGAAHLELGLVGFAGPDDALQLVAGAAQRAGERRRRVALGPGEDLDSRGHGTQRDHAASDRAG